MESYPPQAQANNQVDDEDMEFEASSFITPNRTRKPTRKQFTPGFKADIIFVKT
jgi:hypothetical protein